MTLLVPYRDREEHLKEFVPHMNKYLPGATIVVIEQVDKQKFNRGKLLNVGFLETEDDCYCFHDVDKLPVNADYSFPIRPRQIAPNPHQTRSYFGGVTLFSRKDFEKVGGFNNDYWGWGGEDNELMFQLRRHDITAIWNYGTFTDLPHPRPESEFNLARWEKSKLPRTKDMLKTCEYELISKEVKDGYTVLRVLL